MEVIIDASSEKNTTAQPMQPETNDRDADLRWEVKHRRTPEFDIILLDDTVNPAATDPWGYDVLHEAVNAGNVGAVMSLVHRKDIETFINNSTVGMNGEKVTPLFCALFEVGFTPETLEITRLLLEHGAKPDQELLSRMGASGYNYADDERNMIVRACYMASTLSDNSYAPILTTIWKEGKERLSKPRLDALLQYDNSRKGHRTNEEHKLLIEFKRDFADKLSAVQPMDSYKASNRVGPGGRY